MLSQLRQIVQQFNKDPDLTHGLNTLVNTTRAAIHADCCSLFLCDQELQLLQLMALSKGFDFKTKHCGIPVGQGVIGSVAQKEEPINLPKISSNSPLHATSLIDEASRYFVEQFQAFLVVPIVHRRAVLGVIAIMNRKSRQFSEDEESFLVTLAAQLAPVLIHVQTQEVFRQQAAIDGHQLVRCLTGVAAGNGIAIGEAVVIQPVADLDSISPIKIYRSRHERSRLDQAVLEAKAELDTITSRLEGQIPKEALGIFDVYQQMLSSAGIVQDISALIAEGWSAESALKIQIDRYVSQFEAMQDSYIRERASDVRDLGSRLLKHLLHRDDAIAQLPEQVIVVAEEVTASMLAEIPKTKLRAIVSMRGSANSHSAIMARAMGIPAILGIEELPIVQLSGQLLIVDGYHGTLLLHPPALVIEEYRRLLADEALLMQQLKAEKQLASETQCGTQVRLLLNDGLGMDIFPDRLQSSDGLGLYRTEYPFMIRKSFPSENELVAMYQAVLERFGQKPVTMRTLDIGGDKALPYFPIEEENPFLGWRGIRITLDHPEIFLVQFRAMLRANVRTANLKIMLPMISSIDEIDESIRLFEQACAEIAEELQQDIPIPDLGVMIEVPSIVYLIDKLAKKVAFCSVGSNDLTQYLLAVDRNNSRVATLYDSYHPAVLHALNDIMSRTVHAKIPTSICGELAGDPGGALLLQGLGYRELSLNGSLFAKIKWLIRRVSINECEQLAQDCMALNTAAEVRENVEAFLKQKKLWSISQTAHSEANTEDKP